MQRTSQTRTSPGRTPGSWWHVWSWVCDDYQPEPRAESAASVIVPHAPVPLPKYVPALGPAAMSAIANVVPDFDFSERHTMSFVPTLEFPTATVGAVPHLSEDSTPFRPAVDVSFEYVCESV